MSYLTDPINISLSKSDSRTLMPHQQEAVDSMNNYYDLLNDYSKEQNGLLVMPTGERVIIVTGCNNALVIRVSGTFIENNSCIA